MPAKPTVALVRKSNYAAGMEDPVNELLKLLGGVEAFVKPGQTVLIKPNLLTDRFPDQHVTTHPEVVRALIRILKAGGASISVGDCASSVIKIESVWEKTGFASLCREENVPLLNLERLGSVRFDFNGHSFSIAKAFFDSDVVISVPKVKTHVLTTLTAAVKNMYGAVPGYQKTSLHKLFPNRDDFGRLMAEIYRRTPLHLSIADAIVGMQGDGPSAGTTANLGFLAASTDAVALDLVLCRILGIKPASIPYLRELTGHDGPDAYLERVETLGAGPDDLKIERFVLPRTFPIPRWLVRLLGPFVWIRPAFGDKCVSCGKCVMACPMKALAIRQDGDIPALDTSRCIGCCCCHEICPRKAISMTQSPLLNLARRGRLP